jgi:hypothetical protein
MPSKLVAFLLGALLLPASHASEQETKARPENLAAVNIQSVSSSPRGIAVGLIGRDIQVLVVDVQKRDPKTPKAIDVAMGLDITDIPRNLQDHENGSATINLPIIVEKDPNTQYTLALWAKSVADEHMNWVQDSRPFQGYARPPVDTFKLDFGKDALTISVENPNESPKISKLKAEWQVAKRTVASMDNTSTDPSVPLKYSSLGQTGASKDIPSLILTLEDMGTHEVREARVKLAVASDPSLQAKVDQAKQTGQQGKKKFSWQDLAKTGIGAILTYFFP